MGNTFGERVAQGPDRIMGLYAQRPAIFAPTRYTSRQIRKRVATDTTRSPIEDVLPSNIYRGNTYTFTLEGYVRDDFGRGGGGRAGKGILGGLT